MTIDYLNIACIRCWGCCAHLPYICLRGQEVDCPPLYWYCLSYMMTGTIFSGKKNCWCFSISSTLQWFLYLYLDIMCICCRNTWDCLFFHEVIWTLKQRYQITHVLCSMYCYCPTGTLETHLLEAACVFQHFVCAYVTYSLAMSSGLRHQT